ncbi:MAG: TerC family protein [Alphaproteobacteria bacterium]
MDIALFVTEMIPAFFALVVMEIILGIDNMIFVAVMAGRLPKEQKKLAIRVGLVLGMVLRLAFLGLLFWLSHIQSTLFSVLGHDVSVRDLILLGGGIFLIYKATQEIHALVEGESETPATTKAAAKAALYAVLGQIMVLDVVFALDSIITAVGMTDHLPVMMAAVVGSVIVMLFATQPIAEFVEEHPTVKMLALSLLILVGVSLVADGFHFHIPKGYIYFAVAFSLAVESLNIYRHKKHVKKGKGKGGK